jgi:DNA-binding XRE family transcriptional regulator
MAIEALEKMTANGKMSLADARAEARASQAKLAQEARVSKQVVVNAEKGLLISRISGIAILKALNFLRTEAGLPSVNRKELEWKVEGWESEVSSGEEDEE